MYDLAGSSGGVFGIVSKKIIAFSHGFAIGFFFVHVLFTFCSFLRGGINAPFMRWAADSRFYAQATGERAIV
jgi:hypothetical protein